MQTLNMKGDIIMETKNIKDYCIANISKEDVSKITELEKMISSKTNKDIVLIAYEPSKETQKIT